MYKVNKLNSLISVKEINTLLVTIASETFGALFVF